MYPDEQNPSKGIFVQRFCEMLDRLGIKYEISSKANTTGKTSKIFAYIQFYLGTFVKLVSGNYDIAYVHYASHSSAPVLVARYFKNFKIYTNVHGSDVIPQNKVQNYMQILTRKVLARSSKIIVPSEYFKTVVVKKYQMGSIPIIVFPSSGINRELFVVQQPSKIMKTLLNLGLSTTRTTFCFASRLIEGKGWDTYLKAIDLLRRRGLVANYILVGSGPSQQKVEELITQLHLSKLIVRMPLLSQSELVDIYNCSDVFVFPTRLNESLGLVAVEAMSCGTPVISSDIAAPAQIIEDNFNGFKFRPTDSQDLSNKMASFIEDSSLSQKLVYGCLQTAARFDRLQVATIMKGIFQDE